MTPASSTETLARGALRQQIPHFMRDAVLVTVGVMIVATAVVMALFQTAHILKSRQAQSNLEAQAKYLTSLVDPQAHGWLSVPERSDSSVHKNLTERLQTMRNFYPEIGRLFTARYKDGEIFLILDTTDPMASDRPHHWILRPLGIKLSADSPEMQAIRNGDTAVLKSSDINPADTAASVLVPIHTPGLGEARDFLYVDWKTSVLENQRTLPMVRDLTLLAAGLASVVVGFGFFAWRSEAFLRQKRAETALQQNVELFRSAFEHSPIGMCLLTPNIRIARANKALRDFLGYEQEELAALDLSDYTAPEDVAAEEELYQDLRDRVIPEFQLEKRFRRQNGEIVWGWVHVAVVRDGEGAITQFMAQVVNISARKQAEERLRLNEERLALAANAGGVGIWDLNPSTGAMVWNPVLHEICRTNPSTFVPTFDRYLDLVHFEDRTETAAAFRHSIATGRPFERDFRILTPDQTIRHLRVKAVVFRDTTGQATRAVGTNTDITAEKEESVELTRAKEEAQAADRAKSDFLAVMGHELRTPMNGVLGYLPLLRATALTDEQRGYLETIEQSNESLLTLIDEILDFAKIESGQVQVDTLPFEILPLVQEVYLATKAKAAEKQLKYFYELDIQVPTTIKSDRKRLGQILQSLVDNAVKFTAQGSVTINVTAAPLDHLRKDWEWEFRVRDSGSGISPELVDDIFQPFHQADNSSQRRHGGTGLGLATARSLAAMLGGEILVTSWPGSGSEFVLRLRAPIGGASLPMERTPTAAPAPGLVPPKSQGKRILVVEDNPVNRKLCTLQLSRMGYETDFAETGQEAIEKCRGGGFDAVLMDMQLPDLDGCSATREIRRLNNDSAHLPIIALTANAMTVDRQRCMEAGMDDYMSKPLRVETLATTLAKWL